MSLFDTLVSSTPTTAPGSAPRIVMVLPDHLIADETNTRELREVEALAQGVFALGLDNPLTVRPAPDHPAGYYKIIAGHRRVAACQMCIEWGDPHKFATAGIPCINKGEQSETTAHLRLILNNRLHRNPTGYEEMLETAQLAEMDPDALRAELQKQNPGGAVPAKTRDVIAGLLNMSPAKAAKYLAIYRHLPPERMEDYKAGRIGTEAAYGMVSDMLKQSRKPKPPATTAESPAEPTPAPVFGSNTQESQGEQPQDITSPGSVYAVRCCNEDCEDNNGDPCPDWEDCEFFSSPSTAPQTPPGGAVQASGKNQLAVTMHQIAKEMRTSPGPQQIMDQIKGLIKQHAPEEWREQMQGLLDDMWEAYKDA